MDGKPLERSSNIRAVGVGADAVRLLPANKWRRAVFIQNPSQSDFLMLTNAAGDPLGLFVGPSGAMISDQSLQQEIWARNITSAAVVQTRVFDILGFDVFEMTMWQQNQEMIELLKQIAGKGGRNVSAY